MRSDGVKKGDERGPHRSLLKATGLTDADIRRPFIAIANSYTDVVPGHVHLDAVAEYVKQQVRAAGGTPIVFNTIAICDGIAMGHTGMKYSLCSRELIADCVESMCAAHLFDGMICVTNCDKIVPGMFMGALRVNIPTIFVSGGPMESGKNTRPTHPFTVLRPITHACRRLLPASVGGTAHARASGADGQVTRG